MRLFKKSGGKLVVVKEQRAALERDIQRLTEENLDILFGLQLVKSEFTVRNVRMDTLTFDPSTKAFVVIEYKKGVNTSVIDQGVTYLQLLLNNKAEAVLAYNGAMNKNASSSDFDWTQTRVLFIAESFTSYQVGSLGFKDLPIELWKVTTFDQGLMSYDRIEATGAQASWETVAKGPAAKSIAKEVKVYTEDDHFPKKWAQSKEIYERVKTALFELVPRTELRVLKYYIAFIDPNLGKSFAEIVSKKKGIKVYLRPSIDKLKSPVLKLHDCSKIGHWTNGNTYFVVSKLDDVPHVIDVVKQVIAQLAKN